MIIFFVFFIKPNKIKKTLKILLLKTVDSANRIFISNTFILSKFLLSKLLSRDCAYTTNIGFMLSNIEVANRGFILASYR